MTAMMMIHHDDLAVMLAISVKQAPSEAPMPRRFGAVPPTVQGPARKSEVSRRGAATLSRQERTGRRIAL
jgi:hypothetical protein